jgi:hypothetical protein
MQPGNALINPTQFYPQTVPGVNPAPIQQPLATQTNPAPAAPAAPPNTAPALDTVNLPAAPNTNIPNADLVKTQLANAKAVPVGLKYGLIFGALGALPIWGIEKWSKEPSLIQQLLFMGEKLSQGKIECNPADLRLSGKLLKMVENPLLSFGISAAGTCMVGAITGATLGWWNVKHIKEKLTDINTMKQEQQAGTFQPKPLTLMQRLGLTKKPTNNPDQDYQD